MSELTQEFILNNEARGLLHSTATVLTETIGEIPKALGSLLYSASSLLGNELDYYNPNETKYTKREDIVDSILFGNSEKERLIDLENKLLNYEIKYGSPSEGFYEKWIRDERLDNSELNKWAELYSYLRYAKE